MKQHLAATVVLLSAAGLPAAEPVDYVRDVKPLLKERCYACHGALKQKGKLRLDTVAAMTEGGRNGPAVDPGDPAGSLLIERVADPDDTHRMPPEGKPLTAAQIALLKAWIGTGAKAPKDEQPEADPRSHWAFQPPKRPADPESRIPNPNKSDRRVPRRGVGEARPDARPPADKATLLRRVYLDLTGLPPTRDELHAFLADDSPDAYEKVVDRLLACPRYGERWGRHWMDVWRYSDWYGRRAVPDVLNSYGQVWRWRDWIVRSLNDDRATTGWSRRCSPPTSSPRPTTTNLVATGFLVRNFFRWNYNNWMRDNVEHTAQGVPRPDAQLLPLPRPQVRPDHAGGVLPLPGVLRAAGDPPRPLARRAGPGRRTRSTATAAAYKPITSGMVRVFDEKPDAQTLFYTGGDERNVVDGPRRRSRPACPAALGGDRSTVEPVDLPPEAWYPGLKPFVRRRRRRSGRCDAAAEAR